VTSVAAVARIRERRLKGISKSPARNVDFAQAFKPKSDAIARDYVGFSVSCQRHAVCRRRSRSIFRGRTPSPGE
jgi:hypothetical protein